MNVNNLIQITNTDKLANILKSVLFYDIKQLLNNIPKISNTDVVMGSRLEIISK